MKKKLLATLFMVCFIFVFAPKTVHAYSYYWYVNPIDTLYSDLLRRKTSILPARRVSMLTIVIIWMKLQSVTDQILPGECFMMSLKL